MVHIQVFVNFVDFEAMICGDVFVDCVAVTLSQIAN